MVDVPDLSPDEISRLLCRNPYTCGGCSPRDPVPPEVSRLWPDAQYLPEADDIPDHQKKPIVHLACCSCSKLSVRYLNVTLMASNSSLRATIDGRKMADVPGVSINDNGQHPCLFYDAMVYADQKLGVHGPANFVLTHKLDLRPGEDQRFEVLGSNESASRQRPYCIGRDRD